MEDMFGDSIYIIFMIVIFVVSIVKKIAKTGGSNEDAAEPQDGSVVVADESEGMSFEHKKALFQEVYDKSLRERLCEEYPELVLEYDQFVADIKRAEMQRAEQERIERIHREEERRRAEEKRNAQNRKSKIDDAVRASDTDFVDSTPFIDFADPDEVRRAVIAAEVFNPKYQC